MRRSDGRGWRWSLGVSVAACAAAAVVVTVGVHRQRPASSPVVAPATTAPPASTTTTTVPLPSAPAGSTVVATTKGAIPASTTPGGPSVGTVPAQWYGYPTVLPVLSAAPGWLEVRLAQRPNGSTAWVPISDVTVATTPYRIVIDVATERFKVYQAGAQILDFPAGVGTAGDPTVIGHYFMTMRVSPPSAGYGSFVLVTSAHSDTITDWEGSGDAIIAIHGPIDQSADQEIGSTGARISHGCVRLHDADLAQLSMIPPGSPIDIVAG